MNAHTLQVEFTRVKTQRDDLCDLLTRALPYVEDAANDPAFKGQSVMALANAIRKAVTA